MMGIGLTRYVVGLAAVGLVAGVATGATVPFTEDFNDGASNWRDSFDAGLSEVSGGGVDGSGFVRSTVNFEEASLGMGGSLVIFRGEQNFGASDGAFVGDWLADGVERFSVDLRHDASQPLDFFGRFANRFNFPAGIIRGEEPVEPNEWTTVTFDIDPDNPRFVEEGASFSSAFSDVGNVQVTLSGPENFSETVTFDMDNARIVPEPASLSIGLGLMAIGGIGRRRRRVGRV